MSEKDGGPAFPVDGHVQITDVSHSAYLGMSLRDYFAAKFMAAQVGRYGLGKADNEMALLAYEQADAMLEARK